MRDYCRSVVVIWSAAAVLSVGCNLVPEQVSPARQACRNLDFTDATIDTLLDAAREQEEDGVELGDALEILLAGCEGGCGSASCLVNCPQCAAAVVDQVYN